MKQTLNITLFTDFLITFGFGLASWISPENTFGTLIAAAEMNRPLTISLLSSLSIFYVLIGLTCLAAFKARQPFKNWIAGVMIIRHGWIGITAIIKLNETNGWQIGSPMPDIIIHSAFVFFYLLGIFFSSGHNKAT